MDRTFDAACLQARNETEWSDQIMNRLIEKYPENKDYIQGLYGLYLNMVTNNTSFLRRADYMIEHRETIKLKF